MNKTKLLAYGVAFSLILAGTSLLASCDDMMNTSAPRERAASYTTSSPAAGATTTRSATTRESQPTVGQPAEQPRPVSKTVATPVVPLEAPSVSPMAAPSVGR